MILFHVKQIGKKILLLCVFIGPAFAEKQANSVAVDSPPSFCSRDLPARYSAQARSEKIKGAVTVSLIVDRNGNPTHVRVERSIGHGLGEAAVMSVRAYKWKPAMANGQPVVARTTVDVSFDPAVNPGP